jgi:hypothetical protein
MISHEHHISSPRSAGCCRGEPPGLGSFATGTSDTTPSSRTATRLSQSRSYVCRISAVLWYRWRLKVNWCLAEKPTCDVDRGCAARRGGTRTLGNQVVRGETIASNDSNPLLTIDPWRWPRSLRRHVSRTHSRRWSTHCQAQANVTRRGSHSLHQTLSQLYLTCQGRACRPRVYPGIAYLLHLLEAR